MNKQIPYLVTLAAVTGWILMAGNIAQAQTTDLVDQSVFPQITVQPVDQTVLIGANVVLSVQANNADGYQWLCNGVPLDGETNNTLAIPNAGIDDVGLYSCMVSLDTESVPTRTASLCVETTASATAAAGSAAKTVSTSALAASATTSGAIAAGLPGGGPITVFGTPLLGGGSSGNCPGPYTGYVAYAKTISQGWGWTPISGATVLTATDTNRTNTKVQYLGLYGDAGCAQTTVTIPYPPYSPAYRFWIYFTNNVPNSTNYPIVLTGFNP